MNSMDAHLLQRAAAMERCRAVGTGLLATAVIRIACIIGCLAAATGDAAEPPELRIDLDRRADAVLRDIHFADPDRGWAVGDLGTIWHTADGGQSWRPQNSGTSCNLRSVHFSTVERGLAVGGWYESDTAIARGVLLRTSDGGETWHAVETDLPALHSIRRLAAGTWVAIGGWSPVHRGAVFASEDEGTNWHSIEGDALRQLAAAALSDDGVVAVDDQGVVYSTENLSSGPRAVSTLPDVRVLAAAGPRVAAALGDRSIALSGDGGRNWMRFRPPGNSTGPAPHSAEAAAVAAAIAAQRPLMPLCISVTEERTWIAGTPGTHIIRIDAQGVVSQHPTPVRGPIHAIHFHDRHRGWAVSGFGRIIATRDGGLSWRLQHGDADRAMLLGVAVDPAELPWPVLASEALELGHRYAVAIGTPSPHRSATSSGGESPAGLAAFDPVVPDPVGQTVEAAVPLGGGEVLRWRQDGDQTESIDAVIASCAPSVLVLGADLSDAQRDRWLSLAVRSGVPRVFEVTGEQRSELTVHSSAVLPVAGVITADLWADALAVLAPDRHVPNRLFLRRRWDQSRSDRVASGICDGLQTRGARRRVPDGRRRNYQVLQARSGEATLIQRLVDDARSLDDQSIEQNLAMLLKQTPAGNRQRLLRKLIHRTPGPDEGAGGIRLHLAALAAAAHESTDSGLARRSELRLQSILASEEWQRLRIASLSAVREPQHRVADEVAAHRSPFERSDSHVVQATMDGPAPESPNPAEPTLPLLHAPSTAEAAAPAASRGVPRTSPNHTGAPDSHKRDRLRAPDDMLWQMHPAVLLWKASLGRDAMTSWDRGALDRLQETASAGDWQRLSRAPAERAISAVPIREGGSAPRPLLDGRIDDPCWSNFGTTDPANIDGSPTVCFAYDADFVYVALRGSFGADEAVPPADRRQRDADLRDEVRAVLEIDVDRDLLTAYELSVDARGRTRDTCDGFTDWQPLWYVATGHEAGLQTIEAAIRRADLVALPPVAGDAWRIRARVIKPGQRLKQSAIADPAQWQTLRFQ